MVNRRLAEAIVRLESIYDRQARGEVTVDQDGAGLYTDGCSHFTGHRGEHLADPEGKDIARWRAARIGMTVASVVGFGAVGRPPAAMSFPWRAVSASNTCV